MDSRQELEVVIDCLDILESQAATIIDQAQGVIDSIAGERAALVRIYKKVCAHE